MGALSLLELTTDLELLRQHFGPYSMTESLFHRWNGEGTVFLRGQILACASGKPARGFGEGW